LQFLHLHVPFPALLCLLSPPCSWPFIANRNYIGEHRHCHNEYHTFQERETYVEWGINSLVIQHCLEKMDLSINWRKARMKVFPGISGHFIHMTH
jgi:hypothetical protein